MKRLLLLLTLYSSLALAQTTTTITGTIKDLSGALVTSGQVTFTLQPSPDATMSGLARFTTQTITCLISGAGQVVAANGSSPCIITMNTALQPPGSGYEVNFCPAYSCTATIFMYAVVSSVDITTVISTPAQLPSLGGVVDTFSNQTIGGTKTFTGPVSFGGLLQINGECVLTTTLALALSCAGGSGLIEVPVNTATALSGNLTIPSGVTLLFDGPACLTTTGYTLTINGPLIAPPVTLFCGTGTVTGLNSVMPEWFGANAITPAVQSAFGATGGTLILQTKTYSSSFANTLCWTQSSVWFQGSGQPLANSNQTALVGGTIIQGGLTVAGAISMRFTNLGIDNGSAFAGTSVNDGLAVTGVTGCSTSSPSDPLVTGTRVENVTVMMSSGAVPFHALRLEHNQSPAVRNVTSYFGLHGVTIKSPGASVVGYTTYGEGNDGLIVKSDTYTPAVAGITITDGKSSTINSSNILLNGIIIDAESAGQSSDINISNVQVTNAQAGIQFVSNGTFGASAIDNVNISNFTYLVNSSTFGLTQSYGVLSAGSGSQTATFIHMHGLNLKSTVGAVPFFPIDIASLSLNNSTFENTITDGSNSTGSTFTGTNIVVSGLTETDSTASRPFTVSSGAAVTFNGSYQGATSLSTVVNNGTFYYDATQGNGLGHTNSGSLYFGGQTVTVSALSTATVLSGTSSQSGILRFRDNTSGGAAIFLIDPNGGATLISSQITGLAASGDVTFASSQWKVTLTSGSTPRTLAWTIYD